MPPSRPPTATLLADDGTAAHLAGAAWWDAQRTSLTAMAGVFVAVAALLVGGDGPSARTVVALLFVVAAFCAAVAVVRRAAVARLTAAFAGWAPPGTLLASWADDESFTLVHGGGELRLRWSQLRSVDVRADVVVLRPGGGQVVAVPAGLLPEADLRRITAAVAGRGARLRRAPRRVAPGASGR